MIKIKVRKVDDYNIGITIITENFTGQENILAASFKAFADTDAVAMKSHDLRKTYTLRYDEYEVNGSTLLDANATVTALNQFIGNFKSGGSTPGPTTVEWGDITGTLSDQTDLQAELDRIQNIANGSRFAIVFDNRAQIDEWFAGTYVRPDGQTPDDLFIGELVFVRDADEPDYWWDGTQLIDQDHKTNLSDYYTKTETDGLLDGYVKLESATTQTIKSHIAFDKDHELLGTEKDGSQYFIAGLKTYDNAIIYNSLRDVTLGDTVQKGVKIKFNTSVNPTFPTTNEDGYLIAGDSTDTNIDDNFIVGYETAAFNGTVDKIKYTYKYNGNSGETDIYTSTGGWLLSEVTIPYEFTVTLFDTHADQYYNFDNIQVTANLAQVEIGSEHVHLNLNTDATNDLHPTVDTPSGKQTIAYLEDINNAVSEYYTREETDASFIRLDSIRRAENTSGASSIYISSLGKVATVNYNGIMLRYDQYSYDENTGYFTVIDPNIVFDGTDIIEVWYYAKPGTR